MSSSAPTPRLAPTMEDEFPLFLCADNIDNLHIIRHQGAVVSHVGVYEQTMVLRETPLRVACIGAVCTHAEHRGRGHAGRLMDLAIERARASGNALMLISGDARLYLARGRCASSRTSAPIGRAADNVNEESCEA